VLARGSSNLAVIQFGNPVKKELSPLEATTKQRLMKTGKTFMCVVVTVILGVCNSVGLYECKCAMNSVISPVIHSRDNMIGSLNGIAIWITP
jgi:hypothetical protein